MKVAHEHAGFVGSLLVMLCVLVGGTFVASNSALAGDLRRPPDPTNMSTAGISAGDIEVSIESAHMDADRVTVEYVLQNVSEEPRGDVKWTCPIRKTILADGQGRRYGSKGTYLHCERSAPGTYKVVQDFFEELPAGSGVETELTLRVVVDLNANVLPDGTVGGLDDSGSPFPNVLVDEADPPDPPEQTHVLTFSATSPGDVITEALRVEQSGIEVEMRSLEIMSGTVRTEICLDLPDNDHWIPFISLMQGTTTPTSSFSWHLLYTDNPLTFAAAPHRCYRFTIPFAYRGGATESPLHICIDRVVVLPMGNAMNDPAECEKARLRLAERATGVEVECVSEDGNVVAKIVRSPEGMSQEEASRLVFRAYRRIVEGPWEFTIASE